MRGGGVGGTLRPTPTVLYGMDSTTDDDNTRQPRYKIPPLEDPACLETLVLTPLMLVPTPTYYFRNYVLTPTAQRPTRRDPARSITNQP